EEGMQEGGFTHQGRPPAKKRRRWPVVVSALLLVLAALAAVLEPSSTVRAYLAGEPFYRRKPLRHWRELLRGQGRQGAISRDAWGEFWDGEAALPVLLACARDPDRNVRWPAVALVGHHGKGKRQALA